MCQIIIKSTSLPHGTRIPGVGHLLAARSAILKEDNRILFRSIELSGLHHPSVQLYSLRCGERKSFLGCPTVVRYFFPQRRIVNQRGHHLSFFVPNGIYIRMIVIAPCIDEILIVARELRNVPTLLLRQSIGLTVPVRNINLTVVCIQCGSLIVNITGLFVVAIPSCNVVGTISDGSNHLTVHVIQIPLHVPVPIARQQNAVLANDDTFHGFFFDILRYTLLDQQCSHGTRGIDGIQMHFILMAIQGVNDNLVGVGRWLDAGNIAIGIQRNLQLPSLMALYIIAQHRHL